MDNLYRRAGPLEIASHQRRDRMLQLWRGQPPSVDPGLPAPRAEPVGDVVPRTRAGLRCRMRWGEAVAGRSLPERRLVRETPLRDQLTNGEPIRRSGALWQEREPPRDLSGGGWWRIRPSSVAAHDMGLSMRETASRRVGFPRSLRPNRAVITFGAMSRESP